MNSKKEINWFFVLIIFVLGLTLTKHIDLKNLTLKEPALDTIYIVVFVISIYLFFKDRKNQNQDE